ncbi:MAG: 50S ribosomal protein L23 [Gammaproteobacteria bacterium]|nr:50S ribosomal protein L23 [Gammaproteobacteria bacterium]
MANQERLMQVILGPHISEKSTTAAESSQVVFRVRPDATKAEIRRAVELLFEVKVDAVSVARMPGKAKRFGLTMGRRSAWKKAYVRLAPGQDLDFIGAE